LKTQQAKAFNQPSSYFEGSNPSRPTTLPHPSLKTLQAKAFNQPS